MPKKSNRRRYNLRKVTVNSKSAAGALATGAVASNQVINAAVNSYRLISVDASYSWTDIVAAVDDGCVFGLAHGDYSAAEIEECLESFASIDPGLKIEQERSRRLVRSIGTIQGSHDSANSGAAFNDGRRVKTRLNWLITPGQQLQLWIRNASGVVWTTGSSVSIAGDLWVKDSV